MRHVELLSGFVGPWSTARPRRHRRPGVLTACSNSASAQRHAEDRAAGFEEAAGAEAVQPDGVVADALDDVRHDVHRARVVAGDAERAAVRRAGGSAFVLELVVADVVEAS